jgi:hypothetical protein
VRLLEIAILQAQDSATRIIFSRLCCEDYIIRTMLQGVCCWHKSIIRSLLSEESAARTLSSRLCCEDSIVYQDCTAKTLLSGVCCEDSIILMLYGDEESSRTSETIGDYYSTSKRLCCEDSIIRSLLQGVYCWHESIIMSQLQGLYYHEAVARTLVSEESVVRTLSSRLC